MINLYVKKSEQKIWAILLSESVVKSKVSVEKKRMRKNSEILHFTNSMQAPKGLKESICIVGGESLSRKYLREGINIWSTRL